MTPNHKADWKRLVAHVPASASVLADDPIVVDLAHREHLYVFAVKYDPARPNIDDRLVDYAVVRKSHKVNVPQVERFDEIDRSGEYIVLRRMR
jgi:hypothetical protein